MGKHASKMKVLPFKIPKPDNELIRHQTFEPHLYDILHQHPELQLTLILKGTGNLILGDYIGRFKPGEIYLLGSEVPHVFRNDKEFFQGHPHIRAHSEDIYYDMGMAFPVLAKIKELHAVAHFFASVSGGYKVVDRGDFVRKRILAVKKQSGLKRIITSLEILQHLLCPSRLIKLNVIGSLRNYSPKESRRMQKTLQFLMEQSHRKITLAEVAEVAAMNKEAFCRFFKERTNKTLTQFLNEVRVSNACHLLADKEMTISHVAAETGFQNLSYFNRVFKKIHSCSPKEFRALLHDGQQI